MIKFKILIFLIFIYGYISFNQEQNKDYKIMEATVQKYIRDTEYYKYIKNNNRNVFFLIDNISKDSILRISSKDWKKELDDGVYHFYIPDIRYSYDHILIKENKTCKIFEAINCNGNINKLKRYIKNHYVTREMIIKNVDNIRITGKYLKVDPQSSFNCGNK